MIYFFQKCFWDDGSKVVGASMVGYVLLGLISVFVLGGWVNNGAAQYHGFYAEWCISCSGMFLMLVSGIEFGVTLVVMVGREGTVLKSLPEMLPQCGVFFLIILLNFFALGNPGRFRQLNRDLMRVKDNEPMVEEVMSFEICAVIRGRDRDGFNFDYYLDFAGKHVGISEEMYYSIYEDINEDGRQTYDKKAPVGKYRISYLPNSMIVLRVERVEEFSSQGAGGFWEQITNTRKNNVQITINASLGSAVFE